MLCYKKKSAALSSLPIDSEQQQQYHHKNIERSIREHLTLIKIVKQQEEDKRNISAASAAAAADASKQDDNHLKKQLRLEKYIAYAENKKYICVPRFYFRMLEMWQKNSVASCSVGAAIIVPKQHSHGSTSALKQLFHNLNNSNDDSFYRSSVDICFLQKSSSDKNQQQQQQIIINGSEVNEKLSKFYQTICDNVNRTHQQQHYSKSVLFTQPPQKQLQRCILESVLDNCLSKINIRYTGGIIKTGKGLGHIFTMIDTLFYMFGNNNNNYHHNNRHSVVVIVDNNGDKRLKQWNSTYEYYCSLHPCQRQNQLDIQIYTWQQLMNNGINDITAASTDTNQNDNKKGFSISCCVVDDICRIPNEFFAKCFNLMNVPIVFGMTRISISSMSSFLYLCFGPIIFKQDNSEIWCGIEYMGNDLDFILKTPHPQQQQQQHNRCDNIIHKDIITNLYIMDKHNMNKHEIETIRNDLTMRPDQNLIKLTAYKREKKKEQQNFMIDTRSSSSINNNGYSSQLPQKEDSNDIDDTDLMTFDLMCKSLSSSKKKANKLLSKIDGSVDIQQFFTIDNNRSNQNNDYEENNEYDDSDDVGSFLAYVENDSYLFVPRMYGILNKTKGAASSIHLCGGCVNFSSSSSSKINHCKTDSITSKVSYGITLSDHARFFDFEKFKIKYYQEEAYEAFLESIVLSRKITTSKYPKHSKQQQQQNTQNNNNGDVFSILTKRNCVYLSESVSSNVNDNNLNNAAARIQTDEEEDTQSAEGSAASVCRLTSGGGLISLPCGKGKTITSIYIIHKLGVKTIIMTHFSDLTVQWKERINAAMPNAKVGIIKQDQCEIEGFDIVIASIQSIACRNDYPTHLLREHFGLCIVDECHRVGSRYFSSAMGKITAAWILGLSATPKRKDGMDDMLKYVIGPTVYHMDRERIDVNIIQIVHKPCTKAKYISVPAGTFSKGSRYFKKNNEREYNKASMISDLAMNDPLRTKLILSCIMHSLLVLGQKSIIVLSERINLLEDLETMINDEPLLQQQHTQPHVIPSSSHESDDKKNNMLFSCGLSCAKVKQEKRDEIYRTCDIILTTFQLSREALDVPRLDTLILATPTADVIQAIGRILREYPDKNTPVVYDIIDDMDPFKGYGSKRTSYFKEQRYHIIEKTTTDKFMTSFASSIADKFPTIISSSSNHNNTISSVVSSLSCKQEEEFNNTLKSNNTAAKRQTKKRKKDHDTVAAAAAATKKPKKSVTKKSASSSAAAAVAALYSESSS